MRNIRFFSMIWGTGVDDFDQICLPSLLQPENIPWLLRNGYAVYFDIVTFDIEVPRVGPILARLNATLGDLAGELRLNLRTWDTSGGLPTNADVKSRCFDLAMQLGIESQMKLIFAAADIFYGNGSIRNAVTYAQTPGTVVCGMYLRVDREDALERMRRFQQRSGSTVINNAQLVDISLKTMTEGLKLSIVDNPINCSLTSGSSLRKITEDLYTFILHLPAALVYSFEEMDRNFFFRFGAGQFSAIDHVWPAKLIAQHRWRVLGSSDMFFCAELTPKGVAASAAFDLQTDRQYNEQYEPESLHSNVNGCFVTTLRAEPTDSNP